MVCAWMTRPEDLARELAFYRTSLDPIVRRLLASTGPGDAYDAVVDLRAAMFDELAWLPHGGQVFTAWADLEDIYDMGKTPSADAPAAMRAPASDWLDRSEEESSWNVEQWIERAIALVRAVAQRDGTVWNAPKPGSPKLEWPDGPPLRVELARLVDDDGRDDAENAYFEAANDPQFRTNETAQRRFRSQMRRRLRHRGAGEG